jgi:hypothetical protein
VDPVLPQVTSLMTLDSKCTLLLLSDHQPNEQKQKRSAYSTLSLMRSDHSHFCAGTSKDSSLTTKKEGFRVFLLDFLRRRRIRFLQVLHDRLHGRVQTVQVEAVQAHAGAAAQKWVSHCSQSSTLRFCDTASTADKFCLQHALVNQLFEPLSEIGASAAF